MKSDSQSPSARAKTNPILVILIGVLVGSLFFMAWIVFQLFQNAERDQQYLQWASDLRASSFRLASLSRDATSGDEAAFGELQGVIQSMESTWQKLKSSDAQTRQVLSSQVAAFDGVWTRVRENSQKITQQKDTIIFLHDVATTLNESLPELQAEHNNIVEILLENRAPSDQVSVAQMQSWRAERIGRNVDKMLRGGEGADKAADQFNLDANLFGKVLTGMKTGDIAMSISRVTDTEAVESLDEITELFEFVSGSVREIFEAAPQLFSARQATSAILDEGPEMLLKETRTQFFVYWMS